MWMGWVSLSDNRFVANNATGGGGALHVSDNGDCATSPTCTGFEYVIVKASGDFFARNTAHEGGAWYSRRVDARIDLQNSSFEEDEEAEVPTGQP